MWVSHSDAEGCGSGCSSCALLVLVCRGVVARVRMQLRVSVGDRVEHDGVEHDGAEYCGECVGDSRKFVRHNCGQLEHHHRDVGVQG